MALVSKSIDEETNALANAYDALIAPEKLWRSTNNKIYSVLRAQAAGNVGIIDAALALRNRFDPLYCDETDLYAVAKLVGTEIKEGSGSTLRVYVTNKSEEISYTLPEGEYFYQSASGVVFYFNVPIGASFAPGEEKHYMAATEEKGAFQVARDTNMRIYRSDGEGIEDVFAFSCEGNAGSLGYPDESLVDFRARVINDANRQDAIKEIELAIRNLPSIFECTIVFNESTHDEIYEDFILKPRELLISITGTPTDKIAEIVAKNCVYATHMTDPEKVVYYHNNLYINGRYPVYYREHTPYNFSLEVTYKYDRGVYKSEHIEEEINALFLPYKRMVTYIATFTEADAYNKLDELKLPNVRILNVDIFGEEVIPLETNENESYVNNAYNEDGENGEEDGEEDPIIYESGDDGTPEVIPVERPYISFPRTCIPRLTEIRFKPIVEVGA